MKTYKYTDSTNTVVHIIDEDGISRSSCMASIMEPGTPISPADPGPPVVYVCSPWQIRKALNDLNLRQAVEDAVAISSDQTLKDGWEYATEFRSNDPFVLSMGSALGKTPEQTAELILYASTL